MVTRRVVTYLAILHYLKCGRISGSKYDKNILFPDLRTRNSTRSREMSFNFELSK